MSFHEILFPLDIALKSAGGPERRTDVVVLGSGREERNARWAHSRRRYDAGYGVKTFDALSQVVAFFEDIRHRHVAREWASRSFIWNFLPPVGQFQNGESATGWVVGGLEVAALATFVGCKLLSRSWRNPDNSYGPSGSRNSDERTVRVVEYASAGVFAAAYLYGVIDGIVHYYRPPDETSSSLSLLVFPGGGGLRLTF